MFSHVQETGHAATKNSVHMTVMTPAAPLIHRTVHGTQYYAQDDYIVGSRPVTTIRSVIIAVRNKYPESMSCECDESFESSICVKIQVEIRS